MSGRASICLLALCALLAACGVPGRAAPGAHAVTLYLSTPGAQTRLVPVDPRTLADDPRLPPIVPGTGFWRLSADGTTLVTVEQPGGAIQPPPPSQVTLVVRDAATGRERARFHPPASSFVAFLSDDGSRLVMQRVPAGGESSWAPAPWQWDVLDTATGRPVATAQVDGPCPWLDVDPQARHLYCVTGPRIAGPDDGPRPLTVTAVDLTSGSQLGRLAVPGITAGSWLTGRTVDGQPETDQRWPAVALSPDGSTLAFIGAGADAVALVDTSPLRVARTLALHPATSRAQALAGLLGLAPAVAYAKEEVGTGTSLRAACSPDGRSLYLYGATRTADDERHSHGLGLRVADLANGTITAPALGQTRLFWVLPAPDGSVYTFGPKTDQSDFPRTGRSPGCPASPSSCTGSTPRPSPRSPSATCPPTRAAASYRPPRPGWGRSPRPRGRRVGHPTGVPAFVPHKRSNSASVGPNSPQRG